MMRALALLWALPAAANSGGDPPGRVCAAGGGGAAHRWVAWLWQDTCDCTSMAPQANGSFCDWWSDPPLACGLPQNCNLSKGYQCRVFDNMLTMPTLAGPRFGDEAKTTVPAAIKALSAMPEGKRSLRLFNSDYGINGGVADRVLLPPQHAHCADPPPGPCGGETTSCCEPAGSPACDPGPSFATIFWDTEILAKRAQSMGWFAAFKAAGGELDDLAQDEEDAPKWGGRVPRPPSASLPAANRTAALGCIEARWNALQNDGRFGPVRDELLQNGWQGDLSAPGSLAAALLPFSAGNRTSWVDQTNDTNRVVWNAVQVERQSNYWRTAFGDALREYFPHATHSNFGMRQWAKEFCLPDDSGVLGCRAGRGATGFDAQAPDLCKQQHYSPENMRAMPSPEQSPRPQTRSLRSGLATTPRPTAATPRTSGDDNPLAHHSSSPGSFTAMACSG